MKVIEDPKFSGQNHVQPQYHPQQRAYLFQLQLVNYFEHPLYLYIASSFGCCLQQTSKVRMLQAGHSITLNFRLKLTNLLGNVPDTIAIYASKAESGQLFPLGGCYLKRTQLDFNEDSKMDPAVEEILQVEVEGCVGEAAQFKQKGDWVKALNKYEQAYEIMRKSETALYGMVECRLALKDWVGAMRDLESVFVQRVDNPRCLLAKLKVMMEWQDKKIQEKKEVYDYIKAALRFLKENYHLYYLSVEEKSELERLENEFKKYDRMTEGEVNVLLKHLYDKALQKFPEGHPLTSLYSSQEEFQQEARQLLLQQKSQEIATPEEVLDPISYQQIMKKPYILPSGNSCEEQSLRDYFVTNGYKDPITRQAINYTFVFPNTNMQRYITEHPRLKVWQKYQFDYIHH